MTSSKKLLFNTLFGKPIFVPKNLNFWYVFGALLIFMLALQFVSGLWLAMYYQPSAEEAFNSIEYIMRQVRWGWLIRYIHTTGASALFILLYLHMMRGLIYRSYQSPRQLVWLFGVILFWLMLAEAFVGYLLPWGQMSYWGATVVTNLFSVLPHGDAIVTWIRGDYQFSSVTLTRFYALHIVALPILLIFVIQWHVRCLHQVGSGNPSSLPINTLSHDGSTPKNCASFFPLQALKDTQAAVIFFLIFFAVVFFLPNGLGYFLESLNLIPANPDITPTEIHPLWYMASYYALLRAIPNKWLGILALFASLWMWFLVPWIDRFRLQKTSRLLHRATLILWLISWLLLTYFGLQTMSGITHPLLWISTLLYFISFILLILL